MIYVLKHLAVNVLMPAFHFEIHLKSERVRDE